LLSYSRAGITLGAAALILTVLVAGRFETLSLRLVTILCIVLIAVVPLLQVGSDRLVARYLRSSDDLTVEGRRGTVWIDTIHVAAAFPVFGSGFGTFATVYPQYRSPEVRHFYKHAHNDLLQVAAEGGLIGLVLLFMLLGPLSVAMTRGLAGQKGTLGVGVAAALAAFLLHSLVDFNAHIPANAATAAVLAGVLIGVPCKTTD
jgi:O-antigen ligase